MFFFAFFLPFSHFQIVILVWAPRSWLHVTVRLSPNAIRSGITHVLDGRMRIRYIFQTLFVSRNYIHNEFDWLKNRGTSRIGGTNMGFANVWVFSVKGVVGPRKKSERSNLTERFALKHFFFLFWLNGTIIWCSSTFTDKSWLSANVKPVYIISYLCIIGLLSGLLIRVAFAIDRNDTNTICMYD